jgi:hypothetical protein
MSQPQRPDQRQLGISRAGSGPAPASQFVFARVVVISGTGEVGLFVYNGTPGPGNPPVAYIVPPGTTTDPYGNVLPAQDSIVSVGAGGAYAALNGGQLLLSGPHAMTSPSFLAESTSGAGIVLLNTGLSSALDTASVLQLQSAVNGVALTVLDGADGNTYDTETLRLDAIGAQTISAAANTVITGTSGTGLSCPVAARKYQVTGRVAWQQVTAAVAQEFGFTGPAVSSMDIACDQFEQAGTGQQIFSGNITAIGGHVSTPAVGLGIITAFRFEGELTFSAVGTFAVVALEGTPGDSFTVNPSGAIAWMTVSPV